MSAVAVPVYVPPREQAMRHLKLANEIRLANVAVRREIEEMDRSTAIDEVTRMLRTGDDRVSRLRVGWLLESISGVGEVKAQRFLHGAGIRTASKHVGILTPRQREALADELEDWRVIWSSRA